MLHRSPELHQSMHGKMSAIKPLVAPTPSPLPSSKTHEKSFAFAYVNRPHLYLMRLQDMGIFYVRALSAGE